MNRNYVFLSKRVKKVMKTLVDAEAPLKINDIAYRTESSSRLVYYDLDFINMYLQREGYPRIEPEDSAYFVNSTQRKYLQEMISESVRIGEKDNRLAYIICSLIYQVNKITIDYLAMVLSVSRNTMVSDLQEATNILSEHGLKVLNNKKMGYFVEGDTYTKRHVFIKYLSMFIKSSNYHFMDTFQEDDIQQYIDNVSLIFDNLSLKIKKREIIIIAYLMMCVRVYDQKAVNEEFEVITSSKEYELVDKYFEYVNNYEKCCFTLLIMSVTKSKTIHTENEDTIYQLSKQIIDQYEINTNQKLMDYDTLVYKMYRMLMFKDFCYGLDLPTPYVFTEQIKIEKQVVFDQLVSIIQPMKIEFPLPIYDSEIAEMALLFATHSPFKYEKNKKRVLIVSSNLTDLKQYIVHEILSISDQIEIVDVIDNPSIIHQYSYDYLIATLSLSMEEKNYLRISEIVSDKDIKRAKDWMDL